MAKMHTIRHPYYTESVASWAKWRTIYKGGQYFIDKYLETYSDREGEAEFKKRKRVSYNPAFAQEAVDEIRNSLYQHLPDIVRKGGSSSYNDAVAGINGGVDQDGSSMSSFIGKIVLPELLPLSRVGVYVDMPRIEGSSTLADVKGKRPYIYTYCTEDILSWKYDTSTGEFLSVLLLDHYDTYDEESGLPSGTSERYRRIWIDERGKVSIQYYKYDSQQDESVKEGEEIKLNISRIPLYVADIGNSLLENVDNYQIALLNLASSDMGYSLQSNFPFYTEQFDNRVVSEHLRQAGQTYGGQSSDATQAKPNKINLGTNVGRRYPKDMERPAFIHPSSEPLRASMDKQAQLKEEIRQLVALSVSNIKPKMASAESKGYDRQGLESGLSYIGLELETLERKIAEFWSMYENTKPATVFYPQVYNIKSPSEKYQEAKSLKELQPSVPSKTFQREVATKIAELIVGRDVSVEDLDKIKKEIASSKSISCDPDIISKAVEGGYLNLELAAELLGFPKETVAKAEKEHAARLARIAESQSSQNKTNNPEARGVKDLGGDSKGEKQDAYNETETDEKPTSKVRGEGK